MPGAVMPRRLLTVLAAVVAAFVAHFGGRSLVAALRPVCLTYCVAVTPDGASSLDDAGSTHTVSFTVHNTGSEDDSYHLSCYGPNVVACSIDGDENILLSSSDQTTVSATYTVGSQNAT